jgi:disulfide bond formation protein DsbB
LGHYGLYLAWVVALAATGGSLYLSEVQGYIPCQLCWFQRILMYPFVILLGIASFRWDQDIVKYALPMSIFGLGIATFHYMEQKIPGFGLPELCQVGVPCSAEYFNWLGFITIPFLSLVAFLMITVLMWFVWLDSRQPGERADGAGLEEEL